MSTSQEIDIVLDEILEVDGVTGVLAMDKKGTIIAARMPSIYDYETLNTVTRKLASTLTNIRALGIAFEDITFHYTEIRLIVNNLRRGFLVIMNLPTISIPLLNVATKSARKKIIGILSFTKKA